MLLHDDCNGQPPLKSFPAHTCAWLKQAFLAMLPTRSQRKEAGQDSAVTSEMKAQHHPSERTELPTTCLEGGDFSSLRQKMPLGEQDHSGRRAGETSADAHSPPRPAPPTPSHASRSATVTVPPGGSSSSHPLPPPLRPPTPAPAPLTLKNRGGPGHSDRTLCCPVSEALLTNVSSASPADSGLRQPNTSTGETQLAGILLRCFMNMIYFTAFPGV